MHARTNYVLIDYENVQPTDLAMLRDGPFKVKVFLGANQGKIPVRLAAALQGLGESADYVRLEASGPNALDFHVAYYVGIPEKTLLNTLHALFKKELTGQQLSALFALLRDRGIVRVDGSKVSYELLPLPNATGIAG